MWAIRSEMQTTDKAADLFRMQSFATQLLFKFFFDESSGGMRFVSSLLQGSSGNWAHVLFVRVALFILVLVI